jgi:Spy/CpxP family protein refolding chaperone
MKNSYTMAGLLLALALSASVLAAQTSSSPNQTAPPSATGAPSQTTQPSTGAVPSQTAPPSATGAPAETSPAGQAGTQTTAPQDRGTGNAQASQPAGHPASVEDELQLTAEQKAKLQPIIQDEMAQIDAVRNDTTMSMDQKQAKVQQIKQTSFPKIQAVLTPEQQKKLADLQQRARQQQQGAGASQSPSQSNTQESPKQ